MIDTFDAAFHFATAKAQGPPTTAATPQQLQQDAATPQLKGPAAATMGGSAAKLPAGAPPSSTAGGAGALQYDGAESLDGSTVSSYGPGDSHLRVFATDAPLPWAVFARLRRSGTHAPSLSAAMRTNVSRALQKLKDGAAPAGSSIHDAVPAVGVLVDQACPELAAVWAPLVSSNAATAAATPPPIVMGGKGVETAAISAAVDAGATGKKAGGATAAGAGAKGTAAAATTDAAPESPPPPQAPTAAPAAPAGPRDGSTFALLAILTGSADILELCLQLGADPNDTRFLAAPGPARGALRHGLSPMLMAAVCDQPACMDVLRRAGASLHLADRWGRTPLHAAAALGNETATSWLLSHGAPRLITDRDAFRPGEMAVGVQTLPPRGGCGHVLLRMPTPGGSEGCACGSGRALRECGCVDDMYERWYVDRASSKWVPSEVLEAISHAQSHVLSVAFPHFTVV